MTRLIIFDLDGTLLDTIDDLATSVNHALRKNGYPEHELAEYPFFAELSRRGIGMAVASNKYLEATRKLVTHYFGAGTFRVVLGQREGIAPKPDPTIVYDILSETGVPAEETLYVGDSGVDMRTATNAGLRSAGVTWGFRPRKELEDNGARHIVDTPAELLDLL